MAHAAILDERESLRMPFLESVLLHAAVFGIAGYFAFHTPPVQQWGSPAAGGGGSVAVTPVKTLPLPAVRAPRNPVANDTESNVPAPPPKPVIQKRAPKPEPDAVPLKSRHAPPRPARVDTSQMRYHNPALDRPNQIYSREGAAMASPMFAKQGSGQVGVGPNGPLGNMCGAYAALLQQRVGARWHTGTVDPSIRTAPWVIVLFDLHRDGAISSPRLKQSSGNYQLDQSALRAITEAAPFPPINCGSGGGLIEFWFQLQR